MTTALLYGLIASSGFLIGVLLGLFTAPPRRLLAGVIAFGAGTLVCALTFELMEEAFETGTTAWSLAGFLLGALVYIVIDQALERAAAAIPATAAVIPASSRRRLQNGSAPSSSSVEGR